MKFTLLPVPHKTFTSPLPIYTKLIELITQTIYLFTYPGDLAGDVSTFAGEVSGFGSPLFRVALLPLDVSAGGEGDSGFVTLPLVTLRSEEVAFVVSLVDLRGIVIIIITSIDSKINKICNTRKDIIM